MARRKTPAQHKAGVVQLLSQFPDKDIASLEASLSMIVPKNDRAKKAENIPLNILHYVPLLKKSQQKAIFDLVTSILFPGEVSNARVKQILSSVKVYEPGLPVNERHQKRAKARNGSTRSI